MSELLNQTIGGYLLLEVIGSGGVATVYRARPATGEQREVAFRVIYPEFARQPAIAANFAQITRAAAQLSSHPHILPVIATGEDREYLYLVTPLVKEGSLATWMAKGGRMSAGDVGPFFQQLCAAVSYAHSLGVIHGNIKPSNVFLFEGRHVLLGDFGLLWDVRLLDPSWSGSDVAAFEYLAPEVFDGRVSPASDIYSLGATLFAALTGHPPYHLNRLGDLVAAARQQTPPSLAQQTPPLVGPVVALDTVVRQAMASRPEQRFAAATALGQAIEATLRQAASSPLLGQPAPMAHPAAPPPAHPAPVAPQPPFVGAPPPGPPGGFAAPARGEMSAPLGRLNPPFPPLPPMAGGELAMEGGVGPPAQAFAAPAAPRVEPAPLYGPLDGPTGRVPAPPVSSALPDGIVEEPTAYAPAPFMPSEETMASRLAVIAPIAPPREDHEGVAPGPPTPRRGINSRHSAPMPPAQTPNGPAAPAAAPFSATSLELPRLTNPAMGADLPPDWRDLVTDESARRQHDPFVDGDSALVPLPPMDDYDAARNLPATQVRRPGRVAEAPPAWDASSAAWEDQAARQPRWEEPAPQPHWDEFARDGGAHPGLSGEDEHYDIERMVATSARISVPVKGRARHDDDLDSLHSQKVWTNSRTIVRGKRRSKAPFFTIVALLALTALELGGLALVRPDVCVTHACTVVAAYVHRLAPGLQLPGVTAPVRLIPTVPEVSVLVEGQSKTTFTLSNSSADPITWTATPTLSWMTVSPTRGALAGHAGAPLTVTVKPHGVAPGLYTGALSIYVGDGMSQEPVLVKVTPGAQLAVAQRSLTFTKCGEAQSLTVSDSGGVKLSFTATSLQPDWLQVSPSSGALNPGDSTALAATVVCGAQAGASYDIIIVSNGGSATITATYT